MPLGDMTGLPKAWTWRGRGVCQISCNWARAYELSGVFIRPKMSIGGTKIPSWYATNMIVATINSKLLMEFHLHYKQATEYPLTWLENSDVPVNWYIKKMKL